MKRLLFVVTATVALVSVPGAASAQDGSGGCKEFGQFVAGLAREESWHPFGELIVSEAPMNDEIAFNQPAICE